jgi:hypothetical protein
MLWWGGTMKRDNHVLPSASHTGWQYQWIPQIPVERDCEWLEYKARPSTPPDPTCQIMDPGTRINIEANVRSVAGAYESIVPWNYHPCPGRLDVMRGLIFAMKHIQQLWRSLQGLADSVDSVVACQWADIQIMNNFFTTKQNGIGAKPTISTCCPSGHPWTVPGLGEGPNSKEPCQATECHIAAMAGS